MATQDNPGSRRSPRITRVRLPLAGVIINALVLVGVVVTIVPYLYMISSSFKSNGEIFGNPVTLWPRQAIGTNLRDLFVEFPYARWYLNTIIVAMVGTALNVFLSALAGFAFAKYEFRFRGTLFVILLFTFMLPGQVLLLPQFIEVSVLGWYNTYLAVIVPGAVGAFSIFLMRQYATAVPNELLDAARIDGAGELTIFWYLVVPLLAPAMAVLTILSFNSAWSAFIWPLVVLSRSEMFVLNVGLGSILGPYNYEYGVLIAGSTLASLPLILVFLVFQRQFIEAVSSGALKGG
jgi:multiple sugar transport system permease protein/arabinosaccharide transport system permease protein